MEGEEEGKEGRETAGLVERLKDLFSWPYVLREALMRLTCIFTMALGLHQPGKDPWFWDDIYPGYKPYHGSTICNRVHGFIPIISSKRFKSLVTQAAQHSGSTDTQF